MVFHSFVASLTGTALLLLVTVRSTTAILPTAGIDVTNTQTGETITLLASQASFGPSLPSTTSTTKPSNIVLSKSTLCEVEDGTVNINDGSGLLMVPRGGCTFEQKALNAQAMGAMGIIIYGTLASRYSTNETTQSLVYPLDKVDYDCTHGMANIDRSALDLNEVSYSEANNILLSGDSTTTNLCMLHSENHLANCPSKACLLTGNYTASTAQVCCAWDLHVWLYEDPHLNHTTITIPAVYITMQESLSLLLLLNSNNNNNNFKATLYSRWRPSYNTSSIILWALGVLVATIAAWSSASDYKRRTRYELSTRTRSTTRTTVHQQHQQNDTLKVYHHHHQQQQEEQLELSAEHAFGFILMASSGLFILFFFKIYAVVKVMYAFGCSRALSQVIFEPIWNRCFPNDRIVFSTNTLDLGDITLVNILGFLCGYTWGIVWLIVAFTTRHADQWTFFWVTQDIMGACMCIMFLSIIKLNSIRVASILLLVAFFYDIFFVFVTPLLFKGESIMITVATSGGPPKADPSWCEKYPDDDNCQGGDPLPMLLTIPRFFDYQGGASLLGLGDIVLPGLLLSFAARLDAAKELVGVLSDGASTNGRYYFGPLVIAYAVGLAMANAAVYLMNMGQPALLYLVPCCLGTMSGLGYCRGELFGLWHGPKVIVLADTILYGGSEAAQPVPTEDDGMEEAPMAPSAVDVA